MDTALKPKVFISYSWSSPTHQSQVRQWAERIVSDGIDVLLDIWDLKEGDDKFAYMEKMVTDPSVTHVLVFSDREYVAKADSRTAGVGTESQIISSEVYQKVQQSKFIPVVCEFSDEGEPCLPAFLKSRIWIDFHNFEAQNQNWEQLVRVLYGKPVYEKPTLGKPPAYITTDVRFPPSPVASKFAVFKQSLKEGRPGLNTYRRDFLDACLVYADTLRIRERPNVPNTGERVLEDCGKLKLVRDHIVDWVLLESDDNPSEKFTDALTNMLERLLELKFRPPECTSWQNSWFEAHSVFLYETFLYIIAALLKTASFDILNHIFTTSYAQPNAQSRFLTFDIFWGQSQALQVLAPSGETLVAPAAALISRQANREDLPLSAVVEAELLVLMMALIDEHARWHPHTLLYSSHIGAYPLFARATRHRDFQKLAKITGIASADELRRAVSRGRQRLQPDQWDEFWTRGDSVWELMNMDALDTRR